MSKKQHIRFEDLKLSESDMKKIRDGAVRFLPDVEIQEESAPQVDLTRRELRDTV